MNYGLDTSVVVRLLAAEPPELAEIAQRTLADLNAQGETPFVDDLVIAETYFALVYNYDITKEKALEGLRLLLESGDVAASDTVLRILRTPNLATAKPGFVDRLIHGSYQARNARMVTFERASARLPNVQVLKSQ